MGKSEDFETNSLFSIEPYLINEKPKELSASIVRPKFISFPNHIRDNQILKQVCCLGACRSPWDFLSAQNGIIICDCAFQPPNTFPRIGVVGLDYYELVMSFIKTLQAEKTFNFSMKVGDVPNPPVFIINLRNRFGKAHMAFFQSKRQGLTGHICQDWWRDECYPQHWITRVGCPQNKKARYLHFPRLSYHDFRYPIGK